MVGKTQLLDHHFPMFYSSEMIAVRKNIHCTLISPLMSNASLQTMLGYLIGHPGEKTLSFLIPRIKWNKRTPTAIKLFWD